MLEELQERLPLRAVLFVDGVFGQPEAKTAHGILRHSEIFQTVAIIDRSMAPADSWAVVSGTNLPVVATLKDALSLEPEVLVVALTESDYGEWVDDSFIEKPRQPGDLPEFWVEQIRQAIDRRMDIVSCLHQPLARTKLADRLSGQQKIVDIRQPYHDPPKYSGRRKRNRAKVIHVAGSDSVVGKRTTALELYHSAKLADINAGYIGTGQTCLLIGCDRGAVIDQTPVFQVAGLVEHLIQDAAPHRDLLLIKGQASVTHPAFGGLATGILQGSQPDAVIFAHDPDRTRRYHWEHLPVSDLEKEIRLVEQLGGAPVAAISTRGSANVERLRTLGIPVADPLAPNGAKELLAAALDASKFAALAGQAN